MSTKKLTNEQTYAYNDNQRIVKETDQSGELLKITGEVEEIGKRGLYTLVKLIQNGNYYLVR